jgi:hypothetical protein
MSNSDAIRLAVAFAGALLCADIAPFGQSFSFGVAGFIGAGMFAVLVSRRP